MTSRLYIKYYALRSNTIWYCPYTILLIMKSKDPFRIKSIFIYFIYQLLVLHFLHRKHSPKFNYAILCAFLRTECTLLSHLGDWGSHLVPR
jgi:hypothetical protein